MTPAFFSGIRRFSSALFTGQRRPLSTSTVLGQDSDRDGQLNLETFDLDSIRNFSIVAHIDHGNLLKW